MGRSSRGAKASASVDSAFEYATRNNATDNDDLDLDGSFSYRQIRTLNKQMIVEENRKYHSKQTSRGTILISVLGIVSLWMVAFSSSRSSYTNEGNTREINRLDDVDTGGVARLNRQNGVKVNDKDTTRNSDGTFVEEDVFRKDLAFLEDPLNQMKDSDLPLFWHVPRTGGSTVKSIVGVCFGFTQASELGVSMGHNADTELAVFEIDGVKYINVDTTTIEGINRARTFDLASNSTVDMVFSSYLSEASSLYNADHKGRAFTILRHPIDRAISMFHYLVSNPQLNPIIADMTLTEYAESTHIENNWMVRYLVNQMEGELGKDQLEAAKEVLRRKIFIGLVDEFEESMEQFTNYFNWWAKVEDEEKSERRMDCVSQLVSVGIGVNYGEKPSLEKGDQAWALITWQNQYDIKLYEYASEELFPMQSLQWGTKAKKKQIKKQKKALQKKTSL